MTIYRSIKKALISRSPHKLRSQSQSQYRTSRTFLTAAGTTSALQSPYTPLSFNPFLFSFASSLRSSAPPFLSSPVFRWIGAPPFQGPLFLSSPPWKLLQSATPLYLRGNGVVLRKAESFGVGLDLIRRRVVSGVALRVEEVKECGVWENGFSESFVNLPNLISLGRLISGPIIGWMITHEMYSSAFLGLAISGATDWLDGYVARKMRINSVVGSYLDPLADKVLIGSVALAMVQMDLLHPGLVALVVLRDVALVGGAVFHRAKSLGWKWNSWYDFFNLDGTRPEKVEPLFISKVNTVFQLALVAAALLQPEFGTEDTQSYITYLSWLVASTTVASTAAYGAQYMNNRSALLARKS